MGVRVQRLSELSGSVCLITGAAGKIGQRLCAALLSDGYEVVGTYRRRPPEGTASQTSWPIDEHGHRIGKHIYYVQANLEDRQDVRRVVEVTTALHGTVDCLINCAADIRFHGLLRELWQSEQPVVQQLDTNCVAPMILSSAIFQGLWKNQPSVNASRNRNIINVSSISGLYVQASTGQAFYGASKAALNLLSLHLAAELAPYSIRVNALCPSKISNAAQMDRVIEAIRALMTSNCTGEIKLIE